MASGVRVFWSCYLYPSEQSPPFIDVERNLKPARTSLVQLKPFQFDAYHQHCPKLLTGGNPLLDFCKASSNQAFGHGGLMRNSTFSAIHHLQYFMF